MLQGYFKQEHLEFINRNLDRIILEKKGKDFIHKSTFFYDKEIGVFTKEVCSIKKSKYFFEDGKRVDVNAFIIYKSDDDRAFRLNPIQFIIIGVNIGRNRIITNYRTYITNERLLHLLIYFQKLSKEL